MEANESAGSEIGDGVWRGCLIGQVAERRVIFVPSCFPEITYFSTQCMLAYPFEIYNGE